MQTFLLNEVALAAGNGGFISQVFVMALGVFAAAYFLKGDIQIGSLTNVLILAIIIVILNKTVGAFLNTLAIPFNIASLGLMSFIVDAAVIKLAEFFLSKFRVKSFVTAILMAVIIALTTMVVEWVF